MDVKAATTINRPIEQVYAFWHDFENLPRFMQHLEAVHMTGEKTSQWTTKAPVGASVSWDAETTEDRANTCIAWRSLPGSQIENEGSVHFAKAPGDRGTEVRVQLRYDAPAGAAGTLVAKLFGEEPGQQIRDDLRRFKQVLETGEVTRSESSVQGGAARPLAGAAH